METQNDITMQADMMDLYSRQIGAFGVELMGKLVQMKILIVGLKGVGVETAKNLILAGPNAVHVHDPELTRIEDLGTNFYLSEQDVGRPRDVAVIGKLASLNPYVDVKVHTGTLNENSWKDFHVIIYTSNTSFEHLCLANEYCHNHQKAFIYAANNGATSSIFSDFGANHQINDHNGEPARVNVVENISRDGIVTTSAVRHGLDDGDFVRFEEVEGMSGLNDLKEPIAIKRVYRKVGSKTILVPNQFQLSIDVSNMGKYSVGGIVTQVIVPKTVSFKSLRQSITHPLAEGDFMMHHMDMNKMLMKNQGAQLHFARIALWRFQSNHNGELPRLHNSEDAAECVELARKVLSEFSALSSALVVEELDEDLIKKVSLYARTELPGFCAFVGGVVAQEAVKFPGKFSPLNQWLHHDALEFLSECPPEDSSSIESRYDYQINIFGMTFQEKLFKQKWFLVGAGALGCEYIKGIALMGIGCRGGVVYLTDMDRIEVSNLSRQFLFRRDDVGHAKSVRAADAAKRMNRELNIITSEVPVGPDTEEQFDDAFWDHLDGVWNALDNIKARKYTDSKCVLFEKPLLESGTLGTKANSEIILPHLTTCYNDHKEADEDSIPMCTLRNFPHFIEHCIEWSRAQFSELFTDSFQDLNSLLRNPESFFLQVEKEGSLSSQLEKLEHVKDLYSKIKNGVTFETCVDMAIKEFVKQFRDRIQNLVHLFPEDARKVDRETGADLGPFWAGDKRFPQAAELDPENEVHLDYLYYASNLFAFNLGVPEMREKPVVKKLSLNLIKSIPEWKPQSVKIEVGEDGEEKVEDENDENVEEEESKLNELKNWFRSQDFSKINLLNPAEFEKDDDSNFHIDFITASSNMRAWNYRIKQTTRHQCKMIAGKIIPALATTTAMITGLVELEFYKIVLKLPVDKFCNTNVNLAVNQFQAFEPIAPKKAKVEVDPIMLSELHPVPLGFTVWDKVIVRKGDLTVEEFCSTLADVHFGVKVMTLFKFGISQAMIDEGRGKALYNSNPYLPKSMKAFNETNFKRKLLEVFIEIYGPLQLKQRFVVLDGEFQTKSGDDCKIPRIHYYFN